MKRTGQLVRQRPTRPAFTLGQRLLILDAWRRIGLFLDYYNFQRTNLGIDGLVPADRYFGAASEVLRTLRARVAANALEMARHGVPREPFYLTGQVGGKPFSIHAAGERVIWTDAAGNQREIELAPAQTSNAAKPGAAEPSPHAATRSASTDPARAAEPPPSRRLPDAICPDGSPRDSGPPYEDTDPHPPTRLPPNRDDNGQTPIPNPSGGPSTNDP